MSSVKGHKRKLKNKTVTVKPHSRSRSYGTPRSSFIREVTYDPEGKEMGVNINGKTYFYPRENDSQYRGFQRADSAGKYFNKNVKGNAVY